MTIEKSRGYQTSCRIKVTDMEHGGKRVGGWEHGGIYMDETRILIWWCKWWLEIAMVKD